MTADTGVAVGPPMAPDEEQAHKRRLAVAYADQAEAEVAAIEEKLAGWKETLAAKRTEAKRLRAEADKLTKDGD